jgi:hypothetical protein
LVLAFVLLGTGCATTGSRPLAWDVLQWKDDDWHGSPREAPVLSGEDLVLRGKEMRTQQAYSTPLTVEFDAMLEEMRANDGALSCGFVPIGQPADRDVERAIHISLQYNQNGQTLFVVERFQRWPTHKTKTWAHAPLPLKTGNWCHMKYEVLKDGLHIWIDDHAYDTGGATVPYDRFYIYMSGWQPTNRWHVRNFVVR